MGYGFTCVKDPMVEFSSNAWATDIIRSFLASACRTRFLGGAFHDDRLQALSAHPGPELRVPAESGTQDRDGEVKAHDVRLGDLCELSAE